MASEEQYLDQLLKSMMDNEPKTRSMDEVMREMLGEEAYAQKEAELSKVNSDDSNFDESSTDGVNIVVADSDVQNSIETEEMPVQSSFDEVISNPEEAQGESVISSTAQEEKEEELLITPDALADMLDMLDNPDMFVATEKREESETVNIDTSNDIESVDINSGSSEELSISQDELAAMLDEIDLGAIPQPETVQSEVETVEPVVDIPIVEESIIDIPTKEPVIEEFVVTEPAVEMPIVEEPVAVESVVEMPIAEAPVAVPEMSASDPNAKMSDDDIAAMIAAMNTEETVAETPVVEEPVVEEPVVAPEMPASDPNAKMSDDDIAALFAAMNTEEPAAETPTVEEPVAEEPAEEEPVAVPEMPASDPNAKMSDDDIAALFAAMNTEEPVAETPVVEESVVEEPVAEEPVVEEPVAVPEMPASDPNAKMSDDDIAALFAAMNTEEPAAETPAVEEPVAEEPVVEEPVAAPEMPASDPNAKMSDDDIAALFAAMNTEEPASEEPAVEENAVEEPVVDAAPEMPESDPNAKMSQDDIAAMIAAMNAEEPAPEESATEEPAVEASSEIPESDPNAKMSQDDIAAMIAAMNEEEPASEESVTDSDTEMSQDDLAALLSGIDDSSTETSASNESEGAEADSNAEMSQDDIAALLAGMDSSESTNEPEQAPNAVDMLEKIGDSDEDLLALLEGIDENVSSEDSGDEIGELLDSDESGTKKKEKKKKEKKPFKIPFFGKKKVETADGSEVVADVDEAGNIIADSAQIDALIDSVEASDSSEEGELDTSEAGDISESSSNDKKGKKKKQKKDKKDKGDKKSGFLAGLIELFFDEEEEEEKTEELSNEEILEAVDAENQEAASEEGAGKKGKKGKKDKKDKKGKKGKNAEAKDGEEGEGEEEGDAKKAKKPKKEKKVKEPKEPVEKVPEKRVLSKKATVCLVAFCATLIAAVVILSNILPEHAEISKARAAYYKGDFETVYRNLYNKNLNESDAILYKRAQSVMTLKRRWDSYNNRVKMDRPVEALDSLLEGVYIYNSLKDNADSDIRDELDEIYYEIIGSLQVQYGLTADDAVKVYEIEDEEAYTKVLYSIVYNDVWYLPGEEPVEEPAEEVVPEDTMNSEQADDADDVMTITLEDMLPEEEDF